MDRRNFFKMTGALGAAMAAPRSAGAAETADDPREFVGVLVDTTRCIGCRSCEVACAEAHGLPVPDVEADEALAARRTTSDTQLTVVNHFETEDGDEVFVKTQCMHCWQPACAAACLTKAMLKTHDGPVIWRSDKCMGCRYCMVSCPFEMPKAEYGSWNPEIRKCDLCWDRLVAGEQPACVASCPNDALVYGRRRDLIEIARDRIYNHPDRYVHQIYGEHVAGGTGWLYLSAVPFEQIGFRTDLGTTPYPEYTRDFLYAVPVVLFGVPALLYGMRLLTEKEPGGSDTDEVHDVH